MRKLEVTESAIDTPPQRLHALDAVRGIALLLGIVLHATMSFQGGLAEQDWPIVDVSPSVTLDAVFFVIHVFRMTLFFFIAGFFAHLTFHRRGPREFIRDRMRRIAVPFAIFLPFSIVSTTAIVIWAVWKLNDGSFPADEPESLEDAVFPLTHLWFLYILLWLYGMSLVGRWIVVAIDANGKIRDALDTAVKTLFQSYFAAIVVALPIFVALLTIQDWVWWGGIPTPDQSLLPIPVSLFVYFYMFTLGWLFDRQRELLQSFKRYWLFNSCLGIAAVGVCFSLAGIESNFYPVEDGQDRIIYAVGYAVAVTALSFAFLGAGIQFFSHESGAMRYIADASYWVYLIHLPLVMFYQTLWMDLEWHWAIKFVLVNGLTFVPLFLTYHWWVRSTRIGKMLNGKVYPKTALRRRTLAGS